MTTGAPSTAGSGTRRRGRRRSITFALSGVLPRCGLGLRRRAQIASTRPFPWHSAIESSAPCRRWRPSTASSP
eukprot:5201556-Alexandrium_andersonii.AAC.1